MFCQQLEIKVRVFVEDMSGDFLHEAAHKFENNQASGDNSGHHDKIGRGEEDKFKEITDKRDGEGGGHNTNNRDKEAGAEFIERPGDPVDEDEVDRKSNKNGDSSKFGMRETLEVRSNGKSGHTERDGDANYNNEDKHKQTC